MISLGIELVKSFNDRKISILISDDVNYRLDQRISGL